MANEFLVEIHNYISENIHKEMLLQTEAERRGDVPAACYHEGQLSEWRAIRSFLDERFNLETQRYY